VLVTSQHRRFIGIHQRWRSCQIKEFVKRCQALGVNIILDPESKLVSSKPTQRPKTNTIGTCRKRRRTRSSKDEPAEEDEDKEFEIEKKIGRRVYCGRHQRQIKWVGYEKPTWEDVDNLPPSDDDDSDSDESVPPEKRRNTNAFTINTWFYTCNRLDQLGPSFFSLWQICESWNFAPSTNALQRPTKFSRDSITVQFMLFSWNCWLCVYVVRVLCAFRQWVLDHKRKSFKLRHAVECSCCLCWMSKHPLDVTSAVSTSSC